MPISGLLTKFFNLLIGQSRGRGSFESSQRELEFPTFEAFSRQGRVGFSCKHGFNDYLEYVAAINLVIQGKIGQKLKWYFKLYSEDGNGLMDKKELLSIFTAVKAISGQQTMSTGEFTVTVFQKIDVNDDGQLTLEEFLSGIEKDQDLLELTSKSFDLSNVLKVIRDGGHTTPEILTAD
ncbi:guanylyl cyclase-activating protein 3 [Tachyglossus aculeatus]|uniref:guanylyl cyclase-activating protein 3 n=1 Tax=Tachyglossus aculeatus TaxID=9261 RepID=UPI0018F5676A|nr:guanylyl cyclase-activating protein 3 [Tachyglossus aculeatus]